MTLEVKVLDLDEELKEILEEEFEFDGEDRVYLDSVEEYEKLKELVDDEFEPIYPDIAREELDEIMECCGEKFFRAEEIVYPLSDDELAYEYLQELPFEAAELIRKAMREGCIEPYEITDVAVKDVYGDWVDWEYVSRYDNTIIVFK